MKTLLAAMAVTLSVLMPLSAAAELAADDLKSEDRDAQPIEPPRPWYPMLAAKVGMPGSCAVLFDVDRHGYPISIRAACTHPVFCESATQAMETVRFRPKMVAGRPMPRENVVYPLQYRIGNDDAEIEARWNLVADKPLKDCPGGLVS